MKIDVLVAEIGSTTTAVNAVDLGGGGDTPRLLGQGMGATLEDPGDVTVALRSAIRDLASNLGEASPDDLQWDLMMAAPARQGAVHERPRPGLRHDGEGCQEAALGAGAVIKMVTAGEMTQSDVEGQAPKAQDYPPGRRCGLRREAYRHLECKDDRRQQSGMPGNLRR